ncbi:MAG: hypothetical protein QXS91_01155 [Candidatus Anstonellales archaeon]
MGLGLSDIFQNSIPIWGSAFGIGLAIAVIYYYLSKILNSPSLEKKAFASISGVIESIGLIALLVIFNYFISYYLQTIGSFSCTGDDFHLRLADLALKKYWDRIETKYVFAYLIEAVMSSLFSIHLNIATANLVTGSRFIIAPAYSLHLLINYMAKIIEYLVYILVAVIARAQLISVASYFVAFLLPIGIFFRTLNFTRDFGSGIIAIALVLYFVFPMSVIFTDVIITLYNPDLNVKHLDAEKIVSLYPSAQPIYQEELIAFRESFNNYNILQAEEQIYIGDITPKKGFGWFFASSVFDSIDKNEGLFFGTSLLLSQAGGLSDKEFIKRIANKLGIASNKLAFLDIIGQVFTLVSILLGSKIIGSMFFAFVVSMLVILSNIGVVLLISLVLEITISVTMYKEISQALGGEPLLFALSRLF